MSTMSYTCETVAPSATHTCTWEIPKFLSVLENKRIKEYRTQKSTVDARPQLKMKFLGQDHDVIEIYYSFSTQICVNYVLKTVAYCDKNLKECNNVTAEPNEWNYVTKLFKSEIVNSKEFYFKRYIVSFIGNINYYTDNLVLCITFKCVNNTISEEPHAITRDLTNVLNNGLFSDVTIISSEGKEYKVHKIILACRSAVLRAHFEHDTTECHRNVVESPFDSEVLEEILSYIYSDKVPKINEIPGKILAAADYYQLNELKSLCGKEMCRQLSVKNAVKTLELADLYREDSLKQSTLEFIKQGNAGLIINTEPWDKGMSLQLLKSIYEHIHSSASTEGEVSFCNDDEDEPVSKKCKSMICFTVG